MTRMTGNKSGHDHAALSRSGSSSERKSRSVRVLPGEFYVTGDPELTVVTILGSCVAACVRNPFERFGGLNHFMLPSSEDGNWGGFSAALRYGNFAMEALINEVLKSGCGRRDLEIKLFGGADSLSARAAVGAQNARFVLDYLAAEQLRVVGSDLGGRLGRRIHYSPATGKVRRLLLNSRSEQAVRVEETRYRSHLDHQEVGGSIELF